MAYIFGEDKSKIDFSRAMDPHISALKTACWGWLG
jgi:hypothetical protein